MFRYFVLSQTWSAGFKLKKPSKDRHLTCYWTLHGLWAMCLLNSGKVEEVRAKSATDPARRKLAIAALKNSPPNCKAELIHFWRDNDIDLMNELDLSENMFMRNQLRKHGVDYVIDKLDKLDMTPETLRSEKLAGLQHYACKAVELAREFNIGKLLTTVPSAHLISLATISEEIKEKTGQRPTISCEKHEKTHLKEIAMYFDEEFNLIKDEGLVSRIKSGSTKYYANQVCNDQTMYNMCGDKGIVELPAATNHLENTT